MCFGHVHLLFQLLLDILPFQTYPNLCQLIFTYEVQLVLPIYPWICDFSLEHDQLSRGNIFLRKLVPLSLQLQSTNNYSVRGTIFVPNFFMYAKI